MDSRDWFVVVYVVAMIGAVVFIVKASNATRMK